MEDKEVSLDDLKPLITVDYFDRNQVEVDKGNSFLNGTNDDQVMYTQHNATYNGDLPIQTNQLHSGEGAILNNSVPQLPVV